MQLSLNERVATGEVNPEKRIQSGISFLSEMCAVQTRTFFCPHRHSKVVWFDFKKGRLIASLFYRLPILQLGVTNAFYG